ncbi:MAG: hypothetical protein HGA85_00925 [Nanoarchaeota archaeon]|nr:hypothetical protein [Nanoarchaeota archaeon]
MAYLEISVEEDDLEVWYDEQKDKLTEDYRKRFEKSRHREWLKKFYLSRMRSLHREYESRQANRISWQLKMHFFIHRMKMISGRLLKPFEPLFDRFKKKEQS